MTWLARRAARNSVRKPGGCQVDDNLDMPMLICRQCKTVLAGEGMPPPPDASACPTCGAILKSDDLSVVGGEAVVMQGVITVAMVDYPRALLEEARTLFERHHHGSAVVVAHVAAEIAVQRTMTAALTAKGITGTFQDAILDGCRFSLQARHTQDLYFVLTSQQPHKHQPIWQPYQASVERRNRYVHKGMQASDGEARETLKAVSNFIDYVDAAARLR